MNHLIMDNNQKEIKVVRKIEVQAVKYNRYLHKN